MHAEIVQEYTFEAAHFLPEVPSDHACARLHGHAYRARVHLVGPVDPRTGFVMDFHDLEATCAPIVAQLDHHLLNEVEGLENPTVERIAAWIWDRIAPALTMLACVEVWETPSSGVLYRGPEDRTR
ncbi:MAG: 6-carboxytetrahydropterin synthase QueD [Deltaproteobacteria bacterium]|nr:6-carboxytetrahydropterin synthase QueD [Deltaproteobacteria bacterium]